MAKPVSPLLIVISGLCLGGSLPAAAVTPTAAKPAVKKTDALTSFEGIQRMLSHFSQKVHGLTINVDSEHAKALQLPIGDIKNVLSRYNPLEHKAQVERTRGDKTVHTVTTITPTDKDRAKTGSKVEVDYEYDKKTGEKTITLNEYAGKDIARRLIAEFNHHRLELLNTGWQNLDSGLGGAVTVQAVGGNRRNLKVERSQTEHVTTSAPAKSNHSLSRGAAKEEPKNLKADPLIRLTDDIADVFKDISSHAPQTDANDLLALQTFIMEIFRSDPNPKLKTRFQSIEGKVQQSAVRADFQLADPHPNLYAPEIPGSQPSLHATRQRAFDEEGAFRDTLFLTLRFIDTHHRIVRNMDTGALSYTVTTINDGKPESVTKSFSLGQNNRAVRHTKVETVVSPENDDNAQVYYPPLTVN